MLTIIKSSQTAENMSKMGTAASSVLSTMSEQASNYKTIEFGMYGFYHQFRLLLCIRLHRNSLKKDLWLVP